MIDRRVISCGGKGGGIAGGGDVCVLCIRDSREVGQMHGAADHRLTALILVWPGIGCYGIVFCLVMANIMDAGFVK